MSMFTCDVIVIVQIIAPAVPELLPLRRPLHTQHTVYSEGQGAPHAPLQHGNRAHSGNQIDVPGLGQQIGTHIALNDLNR